MHAHTQHPHAHTHTCACACKICMWHASSMQLAARPAFRCMVHGKCPVLQITCACGAKGISRKIEQPTREIQKRTKRRLFKKNKKAY